MGVGVAGAGGLSSEAVAEPNPITPNI